MVTSSKAASVAMTQEQRQGLTTKLAAHLCQNPNDLNQLAWVPVKLRDKALERLTFTIRRIGVRLMSSMPVGKAYPAASSSRSSTSVLAKSNGFSGKRGNWLAVFGVDAIEAIACDTT
jgi:hypothetical protein